jgi:hypothetical protein
MVKGGRSELALAHFVLWQRRERRQRKEHEGWKRKEGKEGGLG